jgi:hypothetical protein
MPKGINWLPNERVDVPDLTDGTNTLSLALMQQLVNRNIMDQFAHVSIGFRVQIANQGLNPGEFTIFNGNAWDRSGQFLHNNDEENTSRSATLLANGTYYVEVIFVTTPSDTDARGFWDPTFNNGTLPSGDPRLQGREFSENVATRLSPDWQVVSPISTTGFDILTNPNSLRVPVAIIQMTGGVITGATTSPPVTVLENSVLAGVTSLNCFNTIEFPDTFTATVDSEAITVTANDRVNGILQLSAGLANPHNAGARITQTGSPNQFLIDRTAPALPTVGTADARPRFWQGNPNRGYALMQSPYSAARGDTLVQSLKDKVDELAAQIRELKFGAARDADMGLLAPAVSFPVSPREYDTAAGVLGAKTNTVSVGDGVTTWGDFNVTQEGTFAAAMTAAINALGPVGGGSIYIKSGTYTTTALSTIPLIASRSIRIYGSADKSTLILGTGTVPIFAVTNSTTVTFEDLEMQLTSTATSAVHITGAGASGQPTVKMIRCTVYGLIGDDGTQFVNSSFYDCLFVNTTSTVHAVKGDFVNSQFENCVFQGFNVGSAGERALRIGATASPPGTSLLAFKDCQFQGGSAALAVCEMFGGSTANDVSFEHCIFTGGVASGSGSVALLATGNSSITGLVMSNCHASCASGLLDLDNCLKATIRGCRMDGIKTGAVTVTGMFGIRINSVGNSDIRIHDCQFIQGGSSAPTFTAGIRCENVNGLSITDCNFGNMDVAIYMNVVGQGMVSGCFMECFGGRGMFFVSTNAGGNVSETSFIGNHVNGLTDPSGPTGMVMQGVLQALTVSDNSFVNIGSASIAQNIYGLDFSSSGGMFIGDITVEGNHFSSIDAGSANRAAAIVLASSAFATAIKRFSIVCNTIVNIGLDSSLASGIDLVNVTDTTIANNVILAIGKSGAAEGQGILLQFVSRIDVTGNNISDIISDSGGFCATISIEHQANDVLISGNVLDPQGAGANVNANGIALTQVFGDANPIINVRIVDNVIGLANAVNHGNSVVVEIYSTAGSGKIAIDDNTMSGFQGGVLVLDLAGAKLGQISICGNQMRTGFASAAANGITLININYALIANNSIYLTNLPTNSAVFGMTLNAVFLSNVIGNAIWMNDAGGTPQPTFYRVESGSDWVVMNGNFGGWDSTSALPAGHGIDATGAARIYCSGNLMFQANIQYTNTINTGTTGQNF